MWFIIRFFSLGSYKTLHHFESNKELFGYKEAKYTYLLKTVKSQLLWSWKSIPSQRTAPMLLMNNDALWRGIGIIRWDLTWACFCSQQSQIIWVFFPFLHALLSWTSWREAKVPNCIYIQTSSALKQSYKDSDELTLRVWSLYEPSLSLQLTFMSRIRNGKKECGLIARKSATFTLRVLWLLSKPAILLAKGRISSYPEIDRVKHRLPSLQKPSPAW